MSRESELPTRADISEVMSELFFLDEELPERNEKRKEAVKQYLIDSTVNNDVIDLILQDLEDYPEWEVDGE